MHSVLTRRRRRTLHQPSFFRWQCYRLPSVPSGFPPIHSPCFYPRPAHQSHWFHPKTTKLPLLPLSPSQAYSSRGWTPSKVILSPRLPSSLFNEQSEQSAAYEHHGNRNIKVHPLPLGSHVKGIGHFPFSTGVQEPVRQSNKTGLGPHSIFPQWPIPYTTKWHTNCLSCGALAVKLFKRVVRLISKCHLICQPFMSRVDFNKE